jgi:hypothetical protein
MHFADEEIMIYCRALRSWDNNGQKNGASPPDMGSRGVWDAATASPIDITMPGYIIIPVCSWDEIYGNWYSESFDGNFNASYATYPCNKV